MLTPGAKVQAQDEAGGQGQQGVHFGSGGPPISLFDAVGAAVEKRTQASIWTAFIADGGMYATAMQVKTRI